MRGGTHALAGALIGAALTIDTASVVPIAAAIAAGALGALAPDLDHPQAALSRRIGILALPFRLVKHRGILHSGVAAAIAIGAAALVVSVYATAAALGYASHLVLDGMTVQGIPLFWPSGRRFRLLPLTTGGIGELIVLLGLLGAFVALFSARL